MNRSLEEVTREAAQLSPDERLALARSLLEMDEPEAMKDADRLWDAEIRERVLAVERGDVEGIPYEQVLASIDKRLAP